MDRFFLATASIFAFGSVAGGAFGAHALRSKLDEGRLANFETAMRYAMYHALALFVVVWFRTVGPDQVSETIAGVCFVLGVVLFSGSLVALSLSGVRRWGMVAPVGGFSLLIGWAALLVAALLAPLRF